LKSKKIRGYTTLKDVAKKANTSVATVSYILNGSKDRYVSDELRERVLKAAKELNYMKSSMASSLKGKKRGVIGVIIPQFENVFFIRIVQAIEEVAQDLNYIIATCSSGDNPEKEKQIIERLIQQRVDGFIISPTIKGKENIEIIREIGIPYVIIDRSIDNKKDHDFIESDNKGGGFIATEHLLDYGHRNIGFIGWDVEIENLKERLEGYMEAMKKRNLKVKDNWIEVGDLSRNEGYRMTEKLLQDQSISAILFGNHVLAEGGIMALRDKGKKIPQDISVVLIGSPKWTQIGVIKFTCVKQSEAEMGKMAADRLFSIINSTTNELKHIQKKVKNKILIGESVKKIEKKIKEEF
jgi:DNA-binding LacI/PurR family transcriptional regulator